MSIDDLIEKLRREVQYKKSLAVRKAKIENKDGFVEEKNIIVLKIGNALHDKINKNADDLGISRQKIIENILMKHYGMLRKR